MNVLRERTPVLRIQSVATLLAALRASAVQMFLTTVDAHASQVLHVMPKERVLMLMSKFGSRRCNLVLGE